MRTNMEIDENLARRLDVLKNQPRRDPEKAALARVAYLDQAQELAISPSSAVTTAKNRRHIGWMHPLQQLFQFQRKEHSPMFSTLGTILLIVSMVLGGSGVTVAAAQNSLPDDVLYPVKTWSEDMRSGLTSNTQTRLELALAYTNRRAVEMQIMLRAGEVPPEPVQARMRAEIDTALRLAAGQPDHEAVRSLEQIRQQLQVHEQAFAKIGPEAGVQVEAVLERTRAMLQERLQACDQGIRDPEWLRQHMRDQDRMRDGTGPNADQPSGGAKNPWTTGTPTPGSGYGPGVGVGVDEPGGNNPWTTGTPTPGSGYGPGPGEGADESGGNNPWTEGTPTPGSGYGPGPGDGSGDPGGSGSGNPDGAGEPGGGESDGSGEPGGNENPGGDGSGSGSTQDGGGNGNGSPGDGEPGGEGGQGDGSPDGSPDGDSDPGSGTGGPGGKP